jgi:iron(III) transport system substrate-binding protein
MIRSSTSSKFLILIAVSLVMTLNQTVAEAQEVNVYSARKEALIKPLLDKFKAETGIGFNLVTGKADALLKRLETEGHSTPADVFITTDAGRLQRAKEAGVLRPVENSVLSYRNARGSFFTSRTRSSRLNWRLTKTWPRPGGREESVSAPRAIFITSHWSHP